MSDNATTAAIISGAFLEEDLSSSPNVDQLFAALSAFQAGMAPIEKDSEYDLRSREGKFLGKIHYASFEGLQAACKDVLKENGLAVLQPIGHGRLHTIVAHKSGQWMRSSMMVPQGLAGKELGVAVSYARRYSYSSVLGLIVEDADPDPKQRQEPEAPAPQKPQPQQPKPAATGTQAGKGAQNQKPPFADANMPTYEAFFSGSQEQFDKAQEKIKTFTLTQEQKDRFNLAAKSKGREISYE